MIATAYVIPSDVGSVAMHEFQCLKDRYGSLIQICEGQNNQLAFENAVLALPRGRGKIVAPEGSFNFSEHANINRGKITFSFMKSVVDFSGAWQDSAFRINPLISDIEDVIFEGADYVGNSRNSAAIIAEGQKDGLKVGKVHIRDSGFSTPKGACYFIFSPNSKFYRSHGVGDLSINEHMVNIFYSPDCQVWSSEFNNIGNDAVAAYDSPRTKVKSITVIDTNDGGVNLGTAALGIGCPDSLVAFSYIYGALAGVSPPNLGAISVGKFANGTKVLHNTIETCYLGIYGYRVDYVDFSHNTIRLCKRHGIWGYQINRSTISYNESLENSQQGDGIASGICLEAGGANTASHNDVSHNLVTGAKHEFDIKEMQGNYPADYNSVVNNRTQGKIGLTGLHSIDKDNWKL